MSSWQNEGGFWVGVTIEYIDNLPRFLTGEKNLKRIPPYAASPESLPPELSNIKDALHLAARVFRSQQIAGSAIAAISSALAFEEKQNARVARKRALRKIKPSRK